MSHKPERSSSLSVGGSNSPTLLMVHCHIEEEEEEKEEELEQTVTGPLSQNFNRIAKTVG